MNPSCFEMPLLVGKFSSFGHVELPVIASSVDAIGVLRFFFVGETHTSCSWNEHQNLWTLQSLMFYQIVKSQDKEHEILLEALILVQASI